MTSKRQVTLPKRLADEYGIRPGDEIDWEPAGDAIRVTLRGRSRGRQGVSVPDRLALFDEGTKRHEERWSGKTPAATDNVQRGWTRDDLYDRGRTD